MLSASSNLPGRLAGPAAMKTPMNQIAKTTHFARLPAGKVKSEPRTRRILAKIAVVFFSCPLEKLAQRRGVGHRRLAAEVLADVGGGPAVDEGALAQQRRLGRCPPAPPARTRWGRKAARTAAASSRQVVADQGHLLGRGEVEVEGAEQVGEGGGVLGRGLGEEGEDALGLALVLALAAQRARGAAGRGRRRCCRRGSGGRRSPCGGRSAPRGRPRWRRSRRARGRRSGRRIASARARARSNQRGSKVAS